MARTVRATGTRIVSSVPGLVRQCAGIGFPVLAIEGIDRHIEGLPIIKAAPGDGEPVGVRSRHIEALDPACAAEQVPSLAGIERVFHQVVATLH